MADKMTVKQALAVIQSEVYWHAGNGTYYRAERLERVLATIRAEIARLEKDAERYRWLRDGGLVELPYDDHGIGPEYPGHEELDAAIDALMRVAASEQGTRNE